MELVEFLHARLDEDAEAVRTAPNAAWYIRSESQQGLVTEHIDRHNRIQNRVVGMSLLLHLSATDEELRGLWKAQVRQMATNVYAAHPDFQSEWKP